MVLGLQFVLPSQLFFSSFAILNFISSSFCFLPVRPTTNKKTSETTTESEKYVFTDIHSRLASELSVYDYKPR